MSPLGQSRRLSDVGMSASTPTTDVSLRRSEPTLWANFGSRSLARPLMTGQQQVASAPLQFQETPTSAKSL